MKTLPPEILRAMQARATRASITSSSMRGAGSSGVVAAGQVFLCQVDLRAFGLAHVTRFRTQLDATTTAFVRALPKPARHWGLARKGLNIFLRECLYMVYLREHYGLERAERFLEIPLDSVTGQALHRASDGALPRWATVRGLQSDVSDQFQLFAAKLARKKGIARIHLDAIWWGERSRDADV